MIFFSFQLLLGEGGIISYLQRKKTSEEFHDNINELLEINTYLKNQVLLTKHNTSYLLMNAHRVGLLAEDEYLIKTDVPLFTNTIIYTPGKVVLNKESFYFSNEILFFLSLFMMFVILTCKLFLYIMANRASREKH